MNMAAIPAAHVFDFEKLSLERMVADDVATIMPIENAAYPYPWSAGNFYDSLYSGYLGFVLRNHANEMLGYFMLMPAVDEAHLLNITVRPELHGRGLGVRLLDYVMSIARHEAMESVLLEVRPSNERACKVYSTYGFVEIGRRNGYYPTAGNQREDAIVMRYFL